MDKPLSPVPKLVGRIQLPVYSLSILQGSVHCQYPAQGYFSCTFGGALCVVIFVIIRWKSAAGRPGDAFLGACCELQASYQSTEM